MTDSKRVISLLDLWQGFKASRVEAWDHVTAECGDRTLLIADAEALDAGMADIEQSIKLELAK